MHIIKFISLEVFIWAENMVKSLSQLFDSWNFTNASPNHASFALVSSIGHSKDTKEEVVREVGTTYSSKFKSTGSWICVLMISK